MSTQPQESEKTPQPQVLVSDIDAFVHERMKGQPKSLKEIDVKVVKTEAPGKHRLSLPEELESYTKKYTFFWIFKHRRAIDHALNIRGWTLVNRVYFSELPDHLFTVNGSIERGDSILGFMSRKRADVLRQAPGKKSAELMKHLPMERHKTDRRFYEAKITEEGQSSGIELEQGRDFDTGFKPPESDFEPTE